jgi:hypothetical protein
LILFPAQTAYKPAYYAEIIEGRIVVYTKYGRIPYRDASRFLWSEPAGRWVVKNLAGSTFFEDYARDTHRWLLRSSGRSSGAHQRIGSHYLVDSSVFHIDSIDDFMCLDSWLIDNDLPWKSSPGAILLAWFLRDFYRYSLSIDDAVAEELQDSDVGALTACYRYGSFDDCSVVDQNSAYAARAINSSPGLYLGYSEGPRRPAGRHCLFVRARVEAPEIHAPSVGYRNKQVYFPQLGRWETTLPLGELQYAEEIGYHIEPLGYHVFARTLALADFIANIYEMRTGEGFLSTFAKRGLQAFIGKFASSPGWLYWAMENGRFLPKVDIHRPPHWQPQITTWIHAAQRVEIHRAASSLPAWPHILDTDGMLIRSKHVPLVEPQGRELGQWKISRSGDADILGARAYFCNGACLAGYPGEIPDRAAFRQVMHQLDSHAVAESIARRAEKFPQVAVGWSMCERAHDRYGYTRPWTVAEVISGQPWQLMRARRRERLSSIV